ncbi:MAG: caspase family protein [Betaproteobacteria bacterium]
MIIKHLLLLILAVMTGPALAQFRPPAFAGGIPGMAQFQAIQMQRHQARTLLYREALEELRKNPAAADVPECASSQSPQGTLCLARPELSPTISQASPTLSLPAEALKTTPAPIAAPAPLPQPQKISAAETPATPKLPSTEPPAPEQRRLAVLFGNNDYSPPIPGLETPIADVEKIAATLRSRFGYDARVIKNASKAKIIEALNGMAAHAKREDSVLLFYAGHGYLMEDTNMGFWIPIDGSVKTAANWVSNTDISKLLAAIPARQLILVSDSCFSGSLTREQKVDYKGALKPEDVLRKRSVLVFSSGGDEPVSDEGKEGHSIFAWSLIKTLDEATGTTPGQEVWRSVRRHVTQDYSQEPQYGAVLSAGHTEGGEYLFQAR